MSRSLKFRAWCNAYKEMSTNIVSIYGLSEHAFEFPNSNATLDGGDIEVIQFTGLKDSNGVEIYEGDTVCTDLYSAPRFEVVFDNAAFRSKDGKGRVFGLITTGFEVIGNRFENPELLESKP